VSPTLWTDVARDLDAATRIAKSAVQRAATLETYSADLNDNGPKDRQSSASESPTGASSPMERVEVVKSASCNLSSKASEGYDAANGTGTG
jgi:hypothetical protein